MRVLVVAAVMRPSYGKVLRVFADYGLIMLASWLHARHGPAQVPCFARQRCTNLLPWLSRPVNICGVILVATTKLKWVWTIVGLFAAIVPLAAVMYCFIAAMAVLYDPPPL